MQKLIVLFILILHSLAMNAQSSQKFIGSWEGTLSVGVDLRLVFHVEETAEGKFKATMDSPDQGAFGIDCDAVTIDNGSITISMAALGAKYEGRMVNDSNINGNFTQGNEFPLNLSRKKEVKKETEKKEPKKEETPANYKSSEVKVERDEVSLSGTLFEVEDSKKKPVVLIIAGSGPTDRDGNTTAIPGKNNSLLQLAQELAAQEVSTLRYDKRGIGTSKTKGDGREENVTIDKIVDDAIAMHDWLKKQGFKRIFVAGHSEGSLIALLLAQKKDVAGIISIAGAGRKASNLISEQLTAQLPEEIVKEFDEAADSIVAGHEVKKVSSSLQALLRPSIQPYLRSWFPIDPAELIAKVKAPVLIIQGQKDIQVKEKDARLLMAARPDAETKFISDMNHVLKEIATDDRMENIQSYSNPNLPVSPTLVTTIAGFVHKN